MSETEGLDRYELLECLGENQHAKVFRAYDRVSRRKLAIMEFHAFLRRDPAVWEEVWQVILQRINLKHEYIVSVFEVIRERGWVLLELMKGNLARIVETEPIPPAQVRTAMRRALEALNWWHTSGAIHGNIKPGNLLYDRDGFIKLGFSPGLKLGGQVPSQMEKKYLAPELLRSDVGEVDLRLDLYCLGMTALELLMGPRFSNIVKGAAKDAPNPDLAWTRWHNSLDPFPPAKQLVPGIPADLAVVIDRLVQKRVDDRYPDAAAALRDLDEASGDEPVMAAAEPTPRSDPNVPPVHRPQPHVATHETDSATAQQAPTPKPAPLSKPAPTPNPATPRKPASSNRPIAATRQKPVVFWSVAAVFLILVGILANYVIDVLESGKRPSLVKVELKSQPAGAQILVDGKEPTGAHATDGAIGLTPGKHELTFQKDGYQTAKVTLDVKSGAGPLKHHVDLTREEPPQETPKVAKSPPQSKPAKMNPNGGQKTVEVPKPSQPVKPEPVPEPGLVDREVIIAFEPADAPDIQVRIDDAKPVQAKDGEYRHLITGKQQLDSAAMLQISVQAKGYLEKSEKIPLADLVKDGRRVWPLEPEPTPASLLPAGFHPVDDEKDQALDLPLVIASDEVEKGLHEGDVPLQLRLVPPGEFVYGAKAPVLGEFPEEKQRIELPYYIAVFEMTNAQYRVFAEAAGEQVAGTGWKTAADALGSESGNHPVVNVSIQQAQAFCLWLSESAGLPTELQWERAARGTSGGEHPAGSPTGTADAQAADSYNLRFTTDVRGTVPVNSLPHGATGDLGLHQMLGNIAEWCEDVYLGGADDDASTPGIGVNHVIRGSGYLTPASRARLTSRSNSSTGGPDVGFRIVLGLPELAGSATKDGPAVKDGPAQEDTPQAVPPSSESKPVPAAPPVKE